jgi:hypothetical protein
MVVTKFCNLAIGTCERLSSILAKSKGTMASGKTLIILLWLNFVASMDWILVMEILVVRVKRFLIHDVKFHHHIVLEHLMSIQLSKDLHHQFGYVSTSLWCGRDNLRLIHCVCTSTFSGTLMRSNLWLG